MKQLGIIISFLFLMTSISYAGDLEVGKGKIHGYAIADYYYVASHHLDTGDNAVEGLSGFRFRRIYLGYDYKFSDDFSGRVRFEMANAGLTATTTAKMAPVVKDAWLKWSPHKTYNLVMGLSSTPTWDLIESFWGYRSVQKTPLDLQGLGSSRDMGLAVKASFLDKKVGFHFMGGNGSSNKNEDNTNGNKKIMLSVFAKPVGGLVLELYADSEAGKEGSGDNKARTTYQGFAGWQADSWRVGFQGALQKRGQGEGNSDHEVSIISLFGFWKFMEKMTVLARVDHIDDAHGKAGGDDYFPMQKEVTYTTATGTETAGIDKIYYILGFDWEAAKNVHVIPNIGYTDYNKPSLTTAEEVENDLITKLTLYYKWK